MITRLPITKSSNVTVVGYDPDSRVLEIRFKSGKLYRYQGAEQEVFAEVERRNATAGTDAEESVGAYLSATVVKHPELYPYALVDEEVEQAIQAHNAELVRKLQEAEDDMFLDLRFAPSEVAE